MERLEFLDNFERVLESGLIKICRSAEVLGDGSEADGKLLLSPDIEQVWELLIKDYTGDAIANFNDYPLPSIGFAAFLGMAAAHWWDSDWQSHNADSYADYCGKTGFDGLDDHIIGDVLALDPAEAKHVSATVSSCAQATLSYIRKEQIEAQTDTGFYVLVRAFGVLFRIGAAIELRRSGYRAQISSSQKGLTS